MATELSSFAELKKAPAGVQALGAGLFVTRCPTFVG